MFIRTVVHFAKSALVLGALCVFLFLWPTSAAADQVITFNFMGQASGFTINTPVSGTITGTFTLDLTSEDLGSPSNSFTTIVGPWSFSGFGATISSADPEASTVFIDGDPIGKDTKFDILVFGSKNGVINLVFHDSLDYGPLQVQDRVDRSFFFAGDSSVFFTSGFSKPVGFTTEPSSLLLLGTGLLAFGPLFRRR